MRARLRARPDRERTWPYSSLPPLAENNRQRSGTKCSRVPGGRERRPLGWIELGPVADNGYGSKRNRSVPITPKSSVKPASAASCGTMSMTPVPGLTKTSKNPSRAHA